MRIHLIQVGYDDLESPEDRLQRVDTMLHHQAGADLIVLPELWFNGGFSYDRWESTAQGMDGDLVERMRVAAVRAGATLHMGSFIERDISRADGSTQLYNTSVLIRSDGAILATYRKIHRFGFAEGEPRLIEAGEDLQTARVRIADRNVIVGMATCYDLRFPELFRGLVDRGAEIIVLPAAWPLARMEHWSALGLARAIENQVLLVQCNTAGTHAGTEMGGHSSVIDPTGRRLGTAGSGEEILVVESDPDAVTTARHAFPVLSDRRLH